MALNNFFKKILGNKAQRDLREIEPIIEKIQAVYPEIKSLSNDDLRARTASLKERIQE